MINDCPASTSQTSSSGAARAATPVAVGPTVVVRVQLLVVGVTSQPVTAEVLVVVHECSGLDVQDTHTSVTVFVRQSPVVVAELSSS
jgi:hypothetical protein